MSTKLLRPHCHIKVLIRRRGGGFNLTMFEHNICTNAPKDCSFELNDESCLNANLYAKYLKTCYTEE